MESSDLMDTNEHSSNDHSETDESVGSSNANRAPFWQVLVNLIKSNIGVGILNMPQAFSRSGVLVGPILSFLLLIPIFHCTFMLLQCSREQKKRSGKNVIGYAGTLRYSLMPFFQSKARFGVYVVNAMLISSQLGICSAYFVFTAETFRQISYPLLDNTRMWILIMFFVVIVPAVLSRLDIMSILSGSANLLCLFGLTSTFVYIFAGVKSPKNYPLAGKVSDYPLVLATFLYVFEGINSVIPMDNEINDKRLYPLALGIATGATTVLYLLIGFFGYLAYGADVRSAVTLNLPIGTFSNVVRIVYALGIVLTYFIQFYVAMSAMVPTVVKYVDGEWRKFALSVAFRAFFVTFTAMIAAVVPQLDNMISLIGAFACSALCLVFPCVIHIATYWRPTGDSPAISRASIVKDVAIILLGLFLSVTGLYTTVRKIILDYKNHQ